MKNDKIRISVTELDKMKDLTLPILVNACKLKYECGNKNLQTDAIDGILLNTVRYLTMLETDYEKF